MDANAAAHQARQRQRREPDETTAPIEGAAASTALERAELVLADQDTALLDQVTRMRLARTAGTEALRRSHSFRERTEALRKAYESGDESAYDRPPSQWEEDDEGQVTRVIQQGGTLFSKEGDAHYMVPYSELDRIGRKVEQAMDAARVLFTFRMLELSGGVKMADIRRYMDEVVLNDREDVDPAQREAAILAEIEKLFAIGEEQRIDALVQDEMGSHEVLKDEDEYSFTLRMRTLDSRIAVERLDGICQMAIMRRREEDQKMLAEELGEDSAAYQAYAFVLKALGDPDIM